jgi:hypothetical protein
VNARPEQRRRRCHEPPRPGDSTRRLGWPSITKESRCAVGRGGRGFHTGPRAPSASGSCRCGAGRGGDRVALGAHRFDPAARGVDAVGDRFLDRLPLRHAPREVGETRSGSRRPRPRAAAGWRSGTARLESCLPHTVAEAHERPHMLGCNRDSPGPVMLSPSASGHLEKIPEIGYPTWVTKSDAAAAWKLAERTRSGFVIRDRLVACRTNPRHSCRRRTAGRTWLRSVAGGRREERRTNLTALLRPTQRVTTRRTRRPFVAGGQREEYRTNPTKAIKSIS